MTAPSTQRLPAVPPSVWPTAIDERDQNTGDDWVPRLPSLVRLTGKHPFNAEPPTKALTDAGFITPTPMHYVRNHGPVPKLSWGSHRVTVKGLGLDSSVTFSMDDIVAMAPRTLPVTLVCAGNRRKEMNLTRQSKGFSWGPAAVSTSMWTGVPLYRLLEESGIRADHPDLAGQDLWVTFDGPDGELPKGVYGTSVTLRKALDPTSDIMVAYEQNGQRLSPDHGFPVRIIIPGYIGGRMIKWLTRISISSEPSDSFYHYHDNRVLPSMIDPERADKENWWYKPEYIINDLNINSAITHPTQGEEIQVSAPGAATTYMLKGYAYNGGGRRITRIELSFDDGASWELVNISPEEYPTEHGRFWCWRLWEYEVDVLRLVTSKVICLRAWDESQNTQPRDLTWNVLGMMNNSWYRIKPSIERDPLGYMVLRADHPAMVGPPGGWMQPPVAAATPEAPAKTPPGGGGAAQVRVAVPAAVEPSMPRYTSAELAKHNNKEDCWIAVHGKVYDVTSYLNDHPGGLTAIAMCAGTDVTEDFDAIHSAKAHVLLAKFQIGVLDDSAAPPAAEASSPVGGGPGVFEQAIPSVALRGSKNPVQCKLVEKVYESTDLLRVRFALPHPSQRLGIVVGQHVALKTKINGRLVKRSYTPITEPDEFGSFTLLLRVYRSGQHPKFPEGGMMSQFVDRMEIGSSIDVEGPQGCLIYEGKGSMTHLGERRCVKHIAMVAGGTGITPMWQVLRAVLKDSEDKTEVSLVYASRTPADLLLKSEMDALARDHSNFKIWYSVDTFESDEQRESWPFDKGFVTDEMLKRVFPSSGPDVAVFMCGPPPMLNFAVRPALERLGFTPEQTFTF